MANKVLKNKYFDIIFKSLLIILGGFISAYGLEAVLIPNNVSDGGVTGISIVTSQLTGLSLGTLIVLINIPFLVLGYKIVGKLFAMYSIIGIVSLSIGTSFMHKIPTIIEGDTLLITVIGGIIIGLGMGIALRNGGALDGLDVLAVILSRKMPFNTGDIILVLNLFVFIAVGFVFGLKGAFLTAISYFIASKVVSVVEEGLSGSRMYKIITKKPDELLVEISQNLNRTATLSEVKGGFSKEAFTEITCVINQLEESTMKEIIRSTDPDAFVSIFELSEVKGGNFRIR